MTTSDARDPLPGRLRLLDGLRGFAGALRSDISAADCHSLEVLLLCGDAVARQHALGDHTFERLDNLGVKLRAGAAT